MNSTSEELEMFNLTSNVKHNAVASMAISLLVFAGTAIAGPKGEKVVPGKPGINPFAPGGNIVEVALAANDALGGGVFETVYTAATCDFLNGDVAALLTGEDTITLFAPTNAAFLAVAGDLGLSEDDLTPETICDTFGATEELQDALFGVLAYHVTDGRRFSNSVLNQNGNAKEIEMLANGYIKTKNSKVYDGQMNEITIGIADVNASNGVIHVIDRVLLP